MHESFTSSHCLSYLHHLRCWSKSDMKKAQTITFFHKSYGFWVFLVKFYNDVNNCIINKFSDLILLNEAKWWLQGHFSGLSDFVSHWKLKKLSNNANVSI